MLALSSLFLSTLNSKPAKHAKKNFTLRPQRSLRSMSSSHLLDDAPAPGVHRRELHPRPVADQDPHEVAVHPVGDVRHHHRSFFQPDAIHGARQRFHDHADKFGHLHVLGAPKRQRREGGYFRAATGTSRAVRIQGPLAVTATVCSKCADRLLSRVTAVQPSASTFTAGLPALTIGSIARTMPSASRGPRPGSP